MSLLLLLLVGVTVAIILFIVWMVREKKLDQNKNNLNLAGGIVAVVIVIGLIWYFQGGSLLMSLLLPLLLVAVTVAIILWMVKKSSPDNSQLHGGVTDQWYYAQQGQRLGPVSPSELKQLATSGRLQPSYLVWKKGMAQWVAAGQIKGLFTAVQAPTSPPPLPVAPSLPAAQSTNPPKPPPATEESTVCEWCREPIRDDALKCPHCHKWRRDIQDDINKNLKWAVSGIGCGILGAVFVAVGLSGETWREWNNDWGRIVGAPGSFSLKLFLSSWLGWLVLLSIAGAITSIVISRRYAKSAQRKTGGGLREI
jgi:hypothetical protein